MVQIDPQDFRKASIYAIQDNLNAKYSNKVIQNIGLCICVYSILWNSEGLIGHGNGLVNVNVEFELIVFRPGKGEIIFAKISESTPAGIRLRTDFFNDIFVPHDKLPENCVYEPNDKIWVWQVAAGEEEGEEGGDEEPKYEKMYYDNHEMVRVQCGDEEWHDHSPEGPESAPTAEDEENALINPKPSPYKIIGSMQDDGLGVCLWWDMPDQEEEGMEVDQ
ncbi:putative RNA polymerase III subunit Rpc25 [Zalerion maritima]|uniref:DNA-directed RNA polymerase subunit n=1 Tax=Zalerion maritima TaxID=339359 RepID=A0AAD5RYH1_9PEZI|nr:putative RNA polymerase III subunit Rpc25 [Zalerion maritima]